MKLKHIGSRFQPSHAVVPISLGLAALFIWCTVATNSSPVAVFRGIPRMITYIGKLSPNWAKIPKLMPALLETIQVAVVSIVWATLFGLIVGIAGARNLNRHRWLYQAARGVLNFLRSIPSLLYALMFVSMVGLGPLPGIMGLVAHCTGSLGRYFAEAFEMTPIEPIEAAEVDGANRIQIIVHIVLPDRLPLLVGYVLYYFEYCIRTSTLLGLVGAGGIGVPLLMSIRLFRYGDTGAALLVTLVAVFILDRSSAAIRRKILGRERVLK